MSRLRMLNIYEYKFCVRCGNPATGVFKDAWGTRYYCQSHYAKVKELWDLAQDHRESEQWQDQDWFNTPERVKNPQQTLFPALI